MVDIRRNADPAPRPEPRRSAPSPEDIRRQLEQGLASAAPAAVSEVALTGYRERIMAALYQAWIEPKGDAIPLGTVARVRITVERDGRISDHRLIGPSGYERMDASVLEAVRSVRRLPPLPARYAGSSGQFTIAFTLEPR